MNIAIKNGLAISIVFILFTCSSAQGAGEAGVQGGQTMVCSENSKNPNYTTTLVANINFHSPDDAMVNKRLSSRLMYPQGFYIDETNDKLFVIRYSNGKPTLAALEVYRWSDAKYEKTLFLDNTKGFVSEGLVVLPEKNEMYVYVRADNRLVKYLVPSNAHNGDTLIRKETRGENLAQSFDYHSGIWYFEDAKSRRLIKGFTRGDYSIYDGNFEKLGSVSFSPDYAGYKNSDILSMAKHQGFAKTDNGFVMSFGGGWKYGSKTTAFHSEGIIEFDNSGRCITQYLVQPKVVVEALREKNIVANSVENEGVQVLKNGDFILMDVTQISKRSVGGVLLLRISKHKSNDSSSIINLVK